MERNTFERTNFGGGKIVCRENVITFQNFNILSERNHYFEVTTLKTKIESTYIVKCLVWSVLKFCHQKIEL